MQLWDVINVVSLIQGYIGALNHPRIYTGSSQPTRNHPPILAIPCT